jgi:hypothetical protein
MVALRPSRRQTSTVQDYLRAPSREKYAGLSGTKFRRKIYFAQNVPSRVETQLSKHKDAEPVPLTVGLAGLIAASGAESNACRRSRSASKMRYTLVLSDEYQLS